ncbi:MAG: DUF370 domain-containing protein [Chloroflexi bacterium]|nr:DUF370 domain-containing protein [Chloroflexota bacterium]
MNRCGRSEPEAVGMVIEVGDGLITIERIVAVGLATAAPMKRLIREASATKVIVLTGGRKRETAVALDSGHVVITAVPLAEFKRRLEEIRREKGEGRNKKGECF